MSAAAASVALKDTAAYDYLRQRRAALAAHPTRLGLDRVELLAAAPAGPWQLALHFVPAAPGREAKHAVLATVLPVAVRVRLAGASAEAYLRVTQARQPAGTPPAPRLEITLVQPGAAAVGTAELTLGLDGLAELDPFFAEAAFTLVPGTPAAVDCLPVCAPAVSAEAAPTFDYLARDFTAFRRLLLDRLAVAMPDWREDSPADPWIAVVEVLADAADRVSYFEDAVATEAYLGTARRRISVRRHARLLGHTLGEGTNARTWVRLTTSAAVVALPAGTTLLSRVPGLPARLEPGSAELERARAAQPTTFETLTAVTLRAVHNELPLYDWGAPDYALAAGSTSAHLDGAFPLLAVGDVLVLAELRSPTNGRSEDADPAHRHAVRLTSVAQTSDPLAQGGPRAVTAIAWAAEDALPFPLCLAARPAGTRLSGLAAAWGNVVLADHGATVDEDLGTVPAAAPFRPRLGRPGLTFARPAATTVASASATLQAAGVAAPMVRLDDGSRSWTPRADLFASAPGAADFVVEMDDERRAHLRFGDGASGLVPTAGARFTARYRVGGGCAGNLGRSGLYHVVSADPAVLSAENPLPAVGGSEPEALDTARLLAPEAFAGGARCVNVAELACRVEEHPAVARAAAALRSSGSWFTLVVAVERRDGAALTPAFEAELAAFLESDRQAGWELAIVPLTWVGLDIALTVQLEAGAFRGAVERDLLAALGPSGFFAPGRFGFGQAVYLSQVVAVAQAVPGVAGLSFDAGSALEGGRPDRHRFRRFGEPPRGELERGEIPIGGLEIARLDNDVTRPERGRLTFFLEGGR